MTNSTDTNRATPGMSSVLGPKPENSVKVAASKVTIATPAIIPYPNAAKTKSAGDMVHLARELHR